MKKEVFLDLYNRHFMIFIEETQEAVNVALANYFGQPTTLDISECLGVCELLQANGKSLIAVYIAKGRLDVDTFGTIVHESVHAANDLFEYVGIVPDVSNDEPQAYLTDWIARQIFGALNEYIAA